MADKRVLGMAPATLGALTLIVGGFIIDAFVQRNELKNLKAAYKEDISDIEGELRVNRETDKKLSEEHTRLWVRMGVHGHQNN